MFDSILLLPSFQDNEFVPQHHPTAMNQVSGFSFVQFHYKHVGLIRLAMFEDTAAVILTAALQNHHPKWSKSCDMTLVVSDNFFAL